MKTPLRHICLLLSAFTGAYGQDAPDMRASSRHQDAWKLSVRWENDIFNGTDNYYTNGGDLNATSPELILDGGVLETLFAVGPFSQAPGTAYRYNLRFAQDILTPRDYERPTIDPTDRPFAAWLRVAGALRAIEPHRMDVVEVSLGTTGEPALGEFVQDNIHYLIGSPDPIGWDTQVPAEPTLQLSWMRYGRWREDFAHDLAFDIVPSFGGAVGNAHTFGSVGTDLRFGFRLPYDFGHSRIMPASRYGDTFAVRGDRQFAPGEFSVYGVLGFDARIVGRDFALDGALFRDSPSVDKELFVANFTTGIAMQWRRYTFSFRNTYRSPAFDNQPTWHLFGSFNFSVEL
ncbi:MAG: lipid A deacylase LpxR family protein [Opitutales bacterium]